MRPGPWGRVTHPLAAWVSEAVQVGMSRVSHRAGGGGPIGGEGAQDLRLVGWAEVLGRSEDFRFTEQGGPPLEGSEQGVTPRDLLLKSCFQLTLKGSLAGGREANPGSGSALKVLFFPAPYPGLG